MASDMPLHIRITHQSKALGTAVVDVPSSVVPSEPADEIGALRSKLRALSAPLPSDPDGRMWSTLGYFANREGDDLDTEVMAWAMSAITALRRRVAELEAELEEYEHAASYDATMEGPVFKGWNRSSLDRARKRTEARRALDGGGNG
jgi:hypothetical protein